MSSIASPYFALFGDSQKVSAIAQYGITGMFFFLGPLTTLGLTWFTKTFVTRLYWWEAKKCLVIETIGINGGARYTLSDGIALDFEEQTGLYNFKVPTVQSQVKRLRNNPAAPFYINDFLAFEQGNEKLRELFAPLTDKVALFAEMDKKAIEEAAKHGVTIEPSEIASMSRAAAQEKPSNKE